MTTPKGHRRVLLSDFKAKKEHEGAVDLDLGDGSAVIVIPPPQLWPDAIFDVLERNDLAGAAVLLVGGADVYERFVAAGGSAATLFAILKDEHGINVGESPASSSS